LTNIMQNLMHIPISICMNHIQFLMKIIIMHKITMNLVYYQNKTF